MLSECSFRHFATQMQAGLHFRMPIRQRAGRPLCSLGKHLHLEPHAHFKASLRQPVEAKSQGPLQQSSRRNRANVFAGIVP
jgi:hypothetical protein